MNITEHNSALEERGEEQRLAAHPAHGRRTVMLAKMGVMLAITVVFSFIPTFPMLPGVEFIRYEFSDLPILISTFAFGVPAGLVIAVLADILNFAFGGAESGPAGMLMHIVAISAYLVVAGLIYRRKKNRSHAVIGLVAGVFAMTAMMIPANLVITPAFMGVPVAAVKALILPAILPVNLMKGLLSAILTFVLYKRVSPFLHKW
jgi:riboflavin transporter FmnP